MASHSDDEELHDDGPPAIEPYETLGISKTATADEIKTAYRKAALKHHPDKVPSDQKETANTKFQGIVFAYSVLSDPKRRARYDKTGSTSESVDSDNFNWTEYYQVQFEDVITDEAIEKFSKAYKGSIEEKDDVLSAYRKGKGKWNFIYELVMLSSPLEDEERFRGIIDKGIKNGEVDAFKAYTFESKASQAKRMKAAKDESEEAMEYAKELGVAEKLFAKKGEKKGSKKDDESGLAALIKSRQVERDSFFDHLEAKYAAPEKKSKGKKGKKRSSEELMDEPPEEAFLANAAKPNKGSEGRKSKKAKH